MPRAKPSKEIVERAEMMAPWIEAARREGYIAGKRDGVIEGLERCIDLVTLSKDAVAIRAEITRVTDQNSNDRM